MKKITLILLILLLTSFSFAQDENVPRYVNMENSAGLVNPDGFFEYMIIKGDCLWFIADKFYNDPFKWTKIHKANPYIIDPDWIYPNNWLVIPKVFADDSDKPMYSDDVVIDTEVDTSTELTGVAIDLDGDGIVDGVDIDGDGVIDAEAGIDLDGDGVIDGYDMDGDGNIDLLAGTTKTVEVEAAEEAAITALATTAATTSEATPASSITKDKKDHKCDKSHKCDECKHSYCGKPGWKLGLHAGYPVGGGPEGENLNLGLLLGTPLGVQVGPLSVGLGAGVFSYDFDNLYFGGGLLASLCINDLLKLDIPLILQLHSIGFYIFGEEQGLGFGVIGSGSVPLGKSPLSLGLYGALGKYYPNENDYNWSNVGAVLFYTL
jgi:hypothetical protein